ncbi:MAG: M20/M25/M40 family metallo-hydrolase [bacterium]|nr:M20/M25/M40 family metallo-hydrolase [bacterium]
MDHIKLLNQLVSIKSYSGEEDKLRNFISAWFSERKIKNDIQSGNLIVHFEGKDRSKAFIFNSHMDTVSKGDAEWKYGPWNPTKVGKKVIGLGASDMKGGLVASMLLAETIAAKGKPPVDLWFTYVVKEEIDGSGTQSFVEWFNMKGYSKKYKEIAGIFTEPTNLTDIEHGHRGNIFLKVTSMGDSGHGARPELIKKHSVREMVKFADILQKQFKIWMKEYSNKDFGPPTVGEMTSVQSGVAVKLKGSNSEIEVESPNKFPSICISTFDIRTNPKFHRVAFEKISKLGKKMGVQVEYAFPPAPAGFTKPSEKIINVARKIIKETKLTVSKGAADLGFLTELGVKAIIFGPGVQDQGHKVNEYTFPEQIPQAVEIYRQIVEAWAK